MTRDNPLRITAGLIIRFGRFVGNQLRVRRLQAKGLQCSGRIYIYKGAQLSNPKNISIGSGSVIGKSVLMGLGKIEIGERTLIGHDVFLCTGSHDIYTSEFSLTVSPIIIGDNVWVAPGATIMPGVRVGDNAVVAAKAVVFSDVPAGAVAVGNPAQQMTVGRVMSREFNPLALTSIDYETSLRRLREAVRKLFYKERPGTQPALQPQPSAAINSTISATQATVEAVRDMATVGRSRPAATMELPSLATTKESLSLDESQIYDRLSAIFEDVFDDDSIVVGPALSANDVPGWDSLSHIRLILTVEKAFNVKFSSLEIGNLHDVRELVRLIQSRAESVSL